MAAQNQHVDVVMLAGHASQIKIDSPSTADEERYVQGRKRRRGFEQYFKFVQRAESLARAHHPRENVRA